MRTNILFRLATALILCCYTSFSYAEDYVHGGGNQSSSKNYYAPYGNYYRYSSTQSIYTASEMKGAHVITKIAYYVETASSSTTSNVAIYMGHTKKSSYRSSSDAVSNSEMTQVYYGSPTLGATTGFETLTLSTPFTYNGIDNLVVLVCRQASGTNSTLKYAASSYNYNGDYKCLTRGGSSSSYSSAWSTSDYSLYSNRPYARFVVEPIPTVATSNGVVYGKISSDKCVVLDASAASGYVNIPSSIASNGFNYEVVNINYNAFNNNTSISGVTIPSSLRVIGERTFYGCSALKNVTINNGVKRIDSGAFEGTAIESLTIPASVDSIMGGYYTLGNQLKDLTISSSDNPLYLSSYLGSGNNSCSIKNVYVGRDINYTSTYYAPFGSNVETFTWGNKVTKLCDCIFYNNTNLKTITIPQSITSIGNCAFSGTIIEKLSIPNTVKSLGNEVFGYKSNLKSLRIEDGEEPLTIGYTSLNSQNTGLFRSCNQLEDVYIGRNLDYTTKQVSIYNDTYYGAPFEYSKVESVEFGDKVTAIGNYAFYNCKSLKVVKLGENVNTFNRPFDQSGLDTLYTKSTSAIPATNELGYIYDSNSNIKKTIVYVPNGTTSLYRSDYIDLGNGSRRSNFWRDYCIIVDEAEELINVILDKPGQLASRIISQGTMPANVAKLKIKGEMNDTDWELLQPNNMEYLYYLDLSEVTNDSIPSLQFEKDRSYGSYYNGGDLMTILLPTYLKRIGNYAFNKCLRLSDVTFPSTIEEIGACAFQGTPLKELNIPSRSTESFIDSCAFNACTTLEKVTIGNNWNIGTTAFNSCRQLATLSIGQNATIGKQAFVNTALTSLSLSSGTHIGEKAFYQASKLESLRIPGGGTTIGDYAFYGLYNLSSFSIDNGVKSIGNYAFYTSNTTHKVTSVLSFPSSVETIGNYAFYNWGISGLEFGDGTESIGDYAFSGLKSIEAVELPLNLKSLGKNTFAYCTNLKEIEFHSNIESIGQNPFDGCNAINTVTAHWETPVPCNFPSTVYSNAKLMIPRDCAGAYLLADGWKNFASFEEYDEKEVDNNLDLAIKDGENFYNNNNTLYNKITFSKTFSASSVGKWNAFYVPMSIDVEEYAGELDFAEIYSFCATVDTNGDGTVDANDENFLFVRPVKTGCIEPNVPYLIRPKAAKTYIINSADNILYKSTEGMVEFSTTLDKFTVTGLNNAFTVTAGDNNYYVSASGALNIRTTGSTTVKANRWIMHRESKKYGGANDGTSYAREYRIVTIGEDMDETTAIETIRMSNASNTESNDVYTIDGRRVNAEHGLSKGIYIKNGKKYFVK